MKIHKLILMGMIISLAIPPQIIIIIIILSKTAKIQKKALFRKEGVINKKIVLVKNQLF